MHLFINFLLSCIRKSPGLCICLCNHTQPWANFYI
nr:MAG TPA: hypothetical protein [Caudoviricetes sp.]